MADDTSARVAARASTPLLLLAAASFFMPFAMVNSIARSGLGFAAAGHPEAAVAMLLVAAALAVSLTSLRHRISLLVLSSGFAAGALLLLYVRIATATQDAAGSFAAAVPGGGISAFGLLGGVVQQALAPAWTAAYWAALAAAGTVFLLNAWALLRQPEPAPAVALPPAEAPLS